MDLELLKLTPVKLRLSPFNLLLLFEGCTSMWMFSMLLFVWSIYGAVELYHIIWCCFSLTLFTQGVYRTVFENVCLNSRHFNLIPDHSRCSCLLFFPANTGWTSGHQSIQNKKKKQTLFPKSLSHRDWSIKAYWRTPLYSAYTLQLCIPSDPTKVQYFLPQCGFSTMHYRVVKFEDGPFPLLHNMVTGCYIQSELNKTW